MSYAEMIEELRKLDEVTLMELLEIDSEQIVDAFWDTIEDKQEELIKKFNDEL